MLKRQRDARLKDILMNKAVSRLEKAIEYKEIPSKDTNAFGMRAKLRPHFLKTCGNA